MGSNQQTDYDDCKERCSDDSGCGGFIVFGNICFFKNKDCRNDLFIHKGRSAFILQGKVNRTSLRKAQTIGMFYCYFQVRRWDICILCVVSIHYNI